MGFQIQSETNEGTIFINSANKTKTAVVGKEPIKFGRN